MLRRSLASLRLSRFISLLTSFVTNITDILSSGISVIAQVFRSPVTSEVNFFSADDQLGDIFGDERGGSTFLDRYSVADVTQLISSSGIGTFLVSHGIEDWYIEFDLRDSFLHYCYLRRRNLTATDKYLAFLVVQLGNFHVRPRTRDTAGMEFVRNQLPRGVNLLNVRWLSLQNPLAEFSESRPRLPGQRYPGSGFGRACGALVIELARAKGRAGIVNMPEHFHNAVLYANVLRFRFLNPEDEGVFQKIVADLNDDVNERGMAAVSWAISLRFMCCDGNEFVWEPREQVLALSNVMEGYLKRREYRAMCRAAKENAGKFTIRWDEADRYAKIALEHVQIPQSPW